MTGIQKLRHDRGHVANDRGSTQGCLLESSSPILKTMLDERGKYGRVCFGYQGCVLPHF